MPTGSAPRQATLALALCFSGFLLTFWAWALMGPLGATYQQRLGLTSFQQSLVVALPVVVGSLGRIPVGALTDRLGGRTMTPMANTVAVHAPGSRILRAGRLPVVSVRRLPPATRRPAEQPAGRSETGRSKSNLT